jgi:hypothetical protein
MGREPWYDSDNPSRVARGFSWRAALAVVAVVLFVGAISGGIYWFTVATSDVKGAGDQTRIVNDGQNRVNAQEWFHSQLAQIKTADKNLDDAAANLAKASNDKDREFWQTNYTGLKNRCNEMVANYNAETRKVSRGKWLDPDLPYEITDSDPATDCKPSTTPSEGPSR